MTVNPVDPQSLHAGDIALIGMACLFPGAPNLQTYWQNIVGKVSAISDPPPEWEHGGFFDPYCREAERLYCRKGGFLGDLACFDPLEYGVMPQSVDGAEPEHFLALRVAHEALADAGYLARPFNREKAGVILGRGSFVNRGNVTALQHTLVINQTLRLLKQLHPEYHDEDLRLLREQLQVSLPPFNSETAPGLVPNVMCGRIANRLDLKGPNYAVDAACASSLIAVDLAVHELLSRRCDLVLAGGVSVASPPMMFLGFCEIGALSRSQQIRPFDAKADGTLLGEGIGMVVLKRYEDAQRDGDRVYAVIKGVGVASDGRALAVLAPRLEGEELALRRAYEAAGIPPHTVELVEAHGTATPIGDQTEIQALRRVFGDRAGLHPHCALGSVKSMISHTVPAAGVAGLMKAALALYHKTLPPTLNCETPNPKFELEKTSFYINTETRPWIHGAREPRRAGVNAFGFGGINAHVILEETKGINDTAVRGFQGAWDSEVVILQGESRSALIAQAERLRQYLAGSPDVRLEDLAYTFNTKLQDATLRLAIVATSVSEFGHKLTYTLQRLSDAGRQRIKDVSGIYFFEEPLGRTGKLAFLFPGEGPQYVNMLADLCLHFPEVRAHFDQADRVFLDNKRLCVPSKVVFPAPLQEKWDESALWQIDVAVALVFAANRALASLLGCLGIRPDAIVGHSSGEYAALVTADAVEAGNEEELLQYGIELNQCYAAFEDRIPAARLVSVGATRPDVIRGVLEMCPGPLYLAIDNCPHQVILCGTEQSIEPAVAALRSRSAICTVLPFKRGYHTPLFRPISEELRRFFQRVRFAPPQTPVYSCVTAEPFPSKPEEIRELAVAQWSSPVRFRETVEAMYAAGVRIFVEVGPGGNLTGFVDDILRRKPSLAVPVNVSHRSGLEQLNHAVGLLAAHGVSLQLDHLYAHRQPRLLTLERTATEMPSKRRPLRVALELPVARIVNDTTIGTKKYPPEISEPLPSLQQHVNDHHRSVASSEAVLQDAGSGHPLQESPELMKPIYVTQTDDLAGPDPVSSLPIMEYFRTMERFLNVQQEVMQAFLSCGAAPGPKSSWPGPLTHEPSQTPAENRPHPPHDFPLSALTGTEQPMLVVERPAATAGAPVQPQDVAARFLAFVSEKTGYPLEMLDLSLNMEADLGIDSIKRVEIFATFQHDTGLIQQEDMEQAVGLKTLQEVITYLTERSQARPTAMEVGPEPILSEHPRYAPSGRSSSAKESAGPFVRELLSLRVGEEAVVACTLDLRHDQFLRDHTAIGRRISILDSGLVGMPVVPLTVSLEIMAEVAALLLPGKQLIGIKNVQALSWFALEEDRCAIVIHARSQRSDPGDAVAVQLVKASEQTTVSNGKGQPIMQGIVVFGDIYPTSPELGDFTLREGRSYRYSSDRYYEEVMFHGPLFQGVATIDECGEDGIEGTLRSGMETGFFRSQTSADFLLDPILLDAAGQLVGFWTADRLERGFVFPVGFTALHLYGPLRTTTNPVVCRVRILSVNEGRVRADIDCIDATGRMLAQLVGWEDVWFDFSQEFTRFNLSPHDTILSESWPEAAEQLSHMTALHCCRLGRDALPEALFDTTSPMWQLIWARLILNRNEYEKWSLLRGPERRRTEWLLGRLVGKDAVRQLLITRYSLQLCPADIEIDSDHHGALVVRGPWTAITGRAPCLTLAHSDGIAVAIAAECQPNEGIGIDIERVRDLPKELMTATFSPEEYGLIAHLEPALAREWAVRLWCAKEAVGKALGVGLVGGPLNAPVQELDIQTGDVRITLTGQLSRELAHPSDTAFTIYTHCDGDIAVASTLALRSGATYADESNLSTMGCGGRREEGRTKCDGGSAWKGTLS